MTPKTPKLTFLGAARTVTGSKYLLETSAGNLLVDCGFFQGSNHMRRQNRADWPMDPATLDAVVVTHAHLDHIGMLPRLTSSGFTGPIHATSATCDLAEPLLFDSAKLQEEDAAYELKKWRKSSRLEPPPEPLYTSREVERMLGQFVPHAYGELFEPLPGVRCRYRDAGHILGAAEVELWLPAPDGELKIVFSGDLGSRGRPIIRDPDYQEDADFVVMESTYGDRFHPPAFDLEAFLLKLLEQAAATNGHVLIPAFAVGRSQHLLYLFNELFEQHKVPSVPVYLDSPLAQKATEVFARHTECYDEAALALLRRHDLPFEFPGLHMVHSVEESRRLNDLTGPAVIIAGSGMCTGGRILHHLLHHLEHPADVVVFTGYQAEGTLGRRLIEGATEIKLYHQHVQVKAHLENIQTLSAHADKRGLLDWAGHLEGVRAFFVTHGETHAAASLALALEEEIGATAAVPDYLESVELSPAAALAFCKAHRPADLLAETSPA